MKRTLLAILMALLLVIMIPTLAMASSVHTMSASMNVVAVDRSLNVENSTGHVTGTVKYIGNISDAAKKSKDMIKLEGAFVAAIETVDYWVDSNGTVVQGAADGILSIFGCNGAFALIHFHSAVSGNIFVGPASDLGNWEVVKASNALSFLKDASGIWSASVTKTTIAGKDTFAGTATITGNY
jgi:hypothetical protein